MSDHDLDQRVQDIKSQMLYIGIRMVHGALRSRGVRVPQYQVRDCLHGIDPVNTALRWACMSNLLCTWTLTVAHRWQSQTD